MLIKLYSMLSEKILNLTSHDTYDVIKLVNDDYENILKSIIYGDILKKLHMRINSENENLFSFSDPEIEPGENQVLEPVYLKSKLLEKFYEIKSSLDLDKLVTFIIDNNIYLLYNNNISLYSNKYIYFNNIFDKYRLYGYLYNNNCFVTIDKLKYADEDTALIILSNIYTEYITSFILSLFNIYKNILFNKDFNLFDNEDNYNKSYKQDIKSIAEFIQTSKIIYDLDMKKII